MKVSIRSVVACVVVVSFQAQQVLSQSEPYVYAIYYGSDDCGDEPGVLRGYASDQPFKVHGSSDPEGDSCTVGSICLIDPTSDACQDNAFVKEGSATFSISDKGQIFECDDTNPDAECSFLDQCYSSSTFPDCHFQVAATSELVNNPSLIQGTTANPATPSALDESSYLVYYSDSECSQLEGIDGVVNNETNSLAITTEAVSCRDAMACAFHPEEGFNQACLRVLDGGEVEFADWILGPVNPQGEAVLCTMSADDNNNNSTNCEPVPPTVCQKSTMHPSCYYRIATSATLFYNPQDFLTVYSLDGTTENDIPDDTADGPNEEDGSGEEEGGDSKETTEAPSGVVAYGLLGAIILQAVVTMAVAVQ